jgi:hypothetical protein
MLGGVGRGRETMPTPFDAYLSEIEKILKSD